MKTYDVLVIGSGAGLNIAQLALGSGASVAVADKGPLGGTCLNVGCIPSKMLLYPADIIALIQDSQKLGIEARVTSIDFPAIMKRMRALVEDNRAKIRKGLASAKELDFYEEEVRFVKPRTIETSKGLILAKKVFIATGARPLIPDIKGLGSVEYLTNENVVALTKAPKSLIIIGGGYIAAEYAHFFASMGTEVTVLQRGQRLVPGEEPEVSHVLEEEMRKRMAVHTGMEAVGVRKGGSLITVECTDAKGKVQKFSAERVMVAAGRISNADILHAEKGGIALGKDGYIAVDEYLQTNVPGVWAIGDATGREMFRHAANRAAGVAWHNSLGGHHKLPMDFGLVPHAVFSYPQIASIGMTEAEAKKSNKILVGVGRYHDTAKGKAMVEDAGLAKIIIEQKRGMILGFHIIGPEASVLIQEVVLAMSAGLNVSALAQTMHIHPALSEVILTPIENLHKVD